ncbi:MAG: hypothetical protein LBO63_06130 [Oscillospiraceae bacterium]|nr:hypothetical protein [Oscillospiraceae bacterium]
MFVIAAKLRRIALPRAYAAGGYFFQGFASVGDDDLSVPCGGCRRGFLADVEAATCRPPYWFCFYSGATVDLRRRVLCL